MKTKNEYIAMLNECHEELQSLFGVTSLCLFGSVARDEQHEGSDVDVCVDMQPNLFQHVALKRYLEKYLGTSVDVIRRHRNMNPYLKSEIERDGIFVFS